MKRHLSRLIPAIPVALALAGALFPSSCANTTQAPTGGDKDTIPPAIVGIKPLPLSRNVPVNAQITFTFDEYVTVKEAKNIYLSPPQAQRPKYKVKGKSVIVYFEEPLRENTTYALDITSAIADNNEGNMYPGFTLVFSTGPHIDSMLVTGVVRDCGTLDPVKGATVMLYRDHSDSAIFNHRPDAAVKTDDWGYFALRNVKDTLYRLYAIVDEAGDNVYNPDNDLVAFADTLIRPSIVVRETMPEVLKYDMTDTVNCMKRRQEHELLLFRSSTARQVTVNKVRTADRAGYVTFMSPGARVDSLWIAGLDQRRLMGQFNKERDSLEIWINDQRPMPDTVKLFMRYFKTDSTGALVSTVEECALAMEGKKPVSRSSRRDIRHEDTTCVITMQAPSESVEQYGVSMVSGLPLVKASFDSLRLTWRNPRQQEFEGTFTVTRDPWNLRSYSIMPDEPLQKGFEYLLKVPERVFMDIDGHWNDSTEVKFSVPTADDLSTIVLTLSGVEAKYIVELLNEKRDKVLRSYTADSDTTLTFPYLSEGKYSLRLTEDANRNGIVDSGELLSHRQPEMVKFYKIGDSEFLSVPPSAELQQEIDIRTLFKK